MDLRKRRQIKNRCEKYAYRLAFGKLYKKILAEAKRCLLVKGARQVGKTYINFDENPAYTAIFDGDMDVEPKATSRKDGDGRRGKIRREGFLQIHDIDHTKLWRYARNPAVRQKYFGK